MRAGWSMIWPREMLAMRVLLVGLEAARMENSGVESRCVVALLLGGGESVSD